ncbi:MAG: transglutaminase-like domain-containing protein [Verrucomicrobia bacterium]|nr:transglutaminase-like domain-containing protein [Verrucomicrobiota bacterium]
MRTWRVSDCLASAALCLVVFCMQAASAGIDSSGGRELVLRYNFEIRNTGASTVTNGQAWVTAPAERSGVQHSGRLDTVPEAAQVSDAEKNTLLHFDDLTLPPYGLIRAQVEAHLFMHDDPAGEEAGDPSRYLAASAGIESGDGRIVAQAALLGVDSPSGTAQKVFEFVRGHIAKEGYVTHRRGAVYALEQASGDCTEYATLAAALLRASCVPARVVGGYVCPGSRVLAPSGYHEWTEFFADGAWRILDADAGVFDDGYERYVTFRVDPMEEDHTMKNYARFRVVGPGLVMKMETP